MLPPRLKFARIVFFGMIAAGIVCAAGFALQGWQSSVNVPTGRGFVRGMPVLYAAASVVCSFTGVLGLWIVKLITTNR